MRDSDFSDDLCVLGIEDSDREELADEIEDEFLLDEPREVSGGWHLISDIFSDERPEEIPQFISDYDGLNPALGSFPFYSPSDAFKMFFDDTLIRKICNWTNSRADLYFATHPGKRGKVNSLKWHNVTPDDMYIFIALLINMGICKLPKMSQYWQNDWLIRGSPVFCKEVMSRDRFLSIMKFLRFSSPKNMRKDDPRTRIEEYLDELRERSQTVMQPGKHIAVDEALIIWRGQLGFRQDIKNKREKFGVKAFVLCPSDEEWKGYSWNFHLYYGKDPYTVEDPGASGLSVLEQIVVFLMKDLLNSGRHVLTDNWYTSLRLADYLESQRTLLTGVIRNGRGPPTEVQDMKLDKKQSVFARKGNALVVKWMDKKEVCVLTTKYTANLSEHTKTYFGNQTVFFNRPLHLEKYNQKMGSVDLADQLLEPYHYDRKSLAWFKKIGIHFMFRIALNAFIAHRNVCRGATAFLHFLETLAKELLIEHSLGAAALAEVYGTQRDLGPCVQQPLLDIHHFIKWDEPKKQKRCRVCYPIRKATRYYCAGCTGEPGICSTNHFRIWHSEGKRRKTPRKQQKQDRSEKKIDQPTTSGTVHAAVASSSGAVLRRSGRKTLQKRYWSSTDESS